MAEVLIVSGPPGAGKTTVARHLSQSYGLSVHLHTDDFWHAIVSGAIAPHLPESDPQNQTVIGVAAGAAFGYACGGYTTVVDGIVGPWMLHHYLERAARHPSLTLHYVVLRPDRRTTLERAQSRNDPGALVAERPILGLWDQFADLGMYERNVIDTTRLNVIASVEAVRSAVNRRFSVVSGGNR